MNKKSSLSYVSTGVDYSKMDPTKRSAQNAAKSTSSNLANFGFNEISKSRGESAYVWDEGESYKAFVIEGLGTKNLVADEVSKFTNKTYYQEIAQDTVAMIVNDLIVVGALPIVVNAYFGLGNSGWLDNSKRTQDLVEGFAKACNMAGATWGGGETPTLRGVINPDAIDLAGSSVGIINPKNRLTLGDKLQDGDAVLLIESSGMHANGISMARSIAEKLPEGYQTKLSDGTTFGENIVKPTHIYVSLIKDLFENEIDIHYMVNITGHGWRKLMRAPFDFTYEINEIPTPQPLFDFIKEHSSNKDEEMYGNFNMGAGFAIVLPQSQIKKTQEIVTKNGYKSWNAGIVKKGPKQVIINPKNITFKSESLGVR